MGDLTAQAWDNRYRNGQDPWDLGCPAPPFLDLLKSDLAPKPGKIAVLGCGSGQDAMLFSEAGFDVVGFDFAPTAIARASSIAKARGLNTQFLQRNIFELEPEFLHRFDYVLEHTCFCALESKLRSQYVKTVKNLLRPNGQLIGLFYTYARLEGPPFGVTPQEIRDYFAPNFEILQLQAAKNSISRHQGKEHFAIFQLRSS